MKIPSDSNKTSSTPKQETVSFKKTLQPKKDGAYLDKLLSLSENKIPDFKITPGFLPEFPFLREHAIFWLNEERKKKPMSSILYETQLRQMNDIELETYLNITIPIHSHSNQIVNYNWTE